MFWVPYLYASRERILWGFQEEKKLKARAKIEDVENKSRTTYETSIITVCVRVVLESEHQNTIKFVSFSFKSVSVLSFSRKIFGNYNYLKIYRRAFCSLWSPKILLFAADFLKIVHNCLFC